MSHDTWIHRGVRGLVRPLAKTSVTPNQLTTLRLVAGLAAALAFAAGGEDWRAIGAGIFVVSLVLDRADGELARMTGKTSPGGHKFDLWSDAISNALAFLGLGVGLTDGRFGIWAIAMGAFAGAAVAAILLLIIVLERQRGERAGELQGAIGFDPDDGILAVPLLIWLGLSEWLLLAAAIGAPLFAIYMLLKFAKAR